MHISHIPTTSELVQLAIEAGEFFDRLTPGASVQHAAAVSTSIAVSEWCQDHQAPLSAVSCRLWEAVFCSLIAEAAEEAERQQAAANAETDALMDAAEAGDADENGEWKPYDRYYGV